MLAYGQHTRCYLIGNKQVNRGFTSDDLLSRRDVGEGKAATRGGSRMVQTGAGQTKQTSRFSGRVPPRSQCLVCRKSKEAANGRTSAGNDRILAGATPQEEVSLLSLV